jgi:hypothetical protein
VSLKKRAATAEALEPIAAPLDQELTEAAKKADQQMRKRQQEFVASLDLGQFAIKGSDEDWSSALATSGAPSVVSIKSKHGSDGSTSEPKRRAMTLESLEREAASREKKLKKPSKKNQG